LSPLFKYWFYSQCPISRICPDTNNIEQGHSILEYSPFLLLKTLDKYNSNINSTFWQFNLLLTYMFKISFLWKSEFMRFRSCTDFFCLQSLNDDVRIKLKFRTFPCCLRNTGFFVLEMYSIFYSMDQWE